MCYITGVLHVQRPTGTKGYNIEAMYKNRADNNRNYFQCIHIFLVFSQAFYKLVVSRKLEIGMHQF